MKTDAKRGSAIEFQPEGASSHPQRELTGKILEWPFGVQDMLGTGFLARVNSNALALELRAGGLKCAQELPLKVNYKGAMVGDYAADNIAEDAVLLELKACAVLHANRRAQIINCLRALGICVGRLIYFRWPTRVYERFVY
jgi:GxxExxY protein